MENLKQESVVKPLIINNALKGANLIREIVNGINLSFTGSIDDFYFDAKNNKGKDRINFKNIIFESLKYSIANMFDGKYFSNSMRKYFPTKSNYLKAKSEWTEISQANNYNLFFPFLNKYFFNAVIDLHNADQFIFGNEKGSAIKMLILFQEIVLNAVKYSAFVNKKERFLKIKFDFNLKHISIKVENDFQEKVRTKTTGIGHVIIENFARLLNTKPIINKENGIYSVEIKFTNFWEAANK